MTLITLAQLEVGTLQTDLDVNKDEPYYKPYDET
jgi:hypothetical protein